MSRLGEVSGSRLRGFDIKDDADWTGEHQAYHLASQRQDWVGAILPTGCSITPTKFVVLEESHLRAIQLFANLWFRSVGRDLQAALADPSTRELLAAGALTLPAAPDRLSEGDVLTVTSLVETAARSVFGKQFKAATPRMVKSTETSVSHDIVVEVGVGEKADLEALARARHAFFGAVAKAVPKEMLPRVQVLLDLAQ